MKGDCAEVCYKSSIEQIQIILRPVAYKYRPSLWAVGFVWRIPSRGTRQNGIKISVCDTCRLQTCRLQTCRLQTCRLQTCRLQTCRLQTCRLADCRLADLQTADLQTADLQTCRLADCRLADLQSWRLQTEYFWIVVMSTCHAAMSSIKRLFPPKTPLCRYCLRLLDLSSFCERKSKS